MQINSHSSLRYLFISHHSQKNRDKFKTTRVNKYQDQYHKFKKNQK